jgi:hypothetical protein
MRRKVKHLTDFLSNEAPPSTTRQFDITLGAGLMLAGAIKVDTQHIKPAASAQPASVTEQITGLLENHRS